MPRKSKKAKKSGTKRRRVSGVALSAKNPIVAYGSIAAGYLLGDKINDALAKVTGSLDPKIVAAVEALGGFLIRSKVKSLPGQVVGGALMGAGVKKGLQEFGVINGLPTINGYKDMRSINGLPNSVRRISAARVNGPVPSIISGIENNYSSYSDHD